MNIGATDLSCYFLLRAGLVANEPNDNCGRIGGYLAKELELFHELVSLALLTDLYLRQFLGMHPLLDMKAYCLCFITCLC